MRVKVIGAGLAGSECAWQIAKRGIDVTLYEMKPVKFSPAHHNKDFAELVCSNSLKSNDVCSAGGLLKQELRLFGSLLIDCADSCAVPAGSALAVNREEFSQKVTNAIRNNPHIQVVNSVEEDFVTDDDTFCVVATGPLTDQSLIPALQRFSGDFLYFFDAVAPIVTLESVDLDQAFFASRYDKGDDDYLNCPMDREQFELFWSQLVSAQTAQLHDFDYKDVFEGCMPIEAMALRGKDAIRFGPMKPVGLFDQRSQTRPYAVLQLRKENAEGTLFNLVGFQTHLTFPEQRRVFGLIPALSHADYVRYGVMHRNTFINSPRLLNNRFQSLSNPRLFFAGQLTGVEGYVESIASGLVAGVNVANSIISKPLTDLSNETMIGALASHVSVKVANYQPQNANFGILKPLDVIIKDKEQRKQAYVDRALSRTREIVDEIGGQ